MIEVADPGAVLLDAAKRSTSSFVAVAPFVKRAALSRILAELDPSVAVTVVTRWHLPELAAGVSDLEVWPLVAERNGQVVLSQQLHAKVFMFDESLYVTSANITHAAMGWRAQSNEEVIVRTSPQDEQSVQQFVAGLIDRSTPVDDALHQTYANALETFGGAPVPEEAIDLCTPVEATQVQWLPESRDPADVENYYADAESPLTASSRSAVRRDLLALDVPSGLTRQQFRAHVDVQLLHLPIVKALTCELRERQRFGAVVQFVAQELGIEHRDAAQKWQTLSRWLRYFQGNRWHYDRPHYSENIVYRPDEDG